MSGLGFQKCNMVIMSNQGRFFLFVLENRLIDLAANILRSLFTHYFKSVMLRDGIWYKLDYEADYMEKQV